MSINDWKLQEDMVKALQQEAPERPSRHDAKWCERDAGHEGFCRLPPKAQSAVTLEGLAAVITAINTAVVARTFFDGKNEAEEALNSLIAKAREVACGKANEASPDELKQAKLEGMQLAADGIRKFGHVATPEQVYRSIMDTIESYRSVK